MTATALHLPRTVGLRARRVERARTCLPRLHERLPRIRRWTTVLLVAFAVITMSSLALANGNATAGYELRAREHRAQQIREEIRRLELLALDAQAPDRIADRLRGATFIPIAHVEYLTPTDHAVAKR